MPDWEKIKAEYIMTDISYRALAAKYNVGTSSIYRHARREGWISKRLQASDEMTTRYAEAAANDAMIRAARLSSVADELLIKIEEIVKNTTAEKMATWNGRTLRNFTGALKDLREIQGIRHDRDIREQEARIRKLEREALGEAEDKEIKVVIGKQAEEWSE